MGYLPEECLAGGPGRAPRLAQPTCTTVSASGDARLCCDYMSIIVQRQRNTRMHLLRGMYCVMYRVMCAVHVSSMCTECGG
jgi:hypothetical protein